MTMYVCRVCECLLSLPIYTELYAISAAAFCILHRHTETRAHNSLAIIFSISLHLQWMGTPWHRIPNFKWIIQWYLIYADDIFNVHTLHSTSFIHSFALSSACLPSFTCCTLSLGESNLVMRFPIIIFIAGYHLYRQKLNQICPFLCTHKICIFLRTRFVCS